MAGDRGFLFPELTASSVKASFNPAQENGKIYSCTATCEMAIRENTGNETASILQLIESALNQKSDEKKGE